METSINSVKLSGRAGSDLKITALKEEGKKVARVSIASTSFFKNKEGEVKEKTNWFNLVFWNEKADKAAEFIKKGTEFAIEGHLASQTYKDKKNKTQYTTDIIVDKLSIDVKEK